MSSSPYDLLDTEQIIHIFASTIITEVLGLEYRPATDGVAGTLSIPPDVQRRLVSLIEMKERLTQNLEKDSDPQRAAFALQHALLTHIKARASELGLIDHGYNRSILSLSALLQEDLLKETKRGGQPTAEAEKWDKTAAFVEACFKIAVNSP